MKTLDEVIKAYEYCIDNNYRDCRGCPYGCEDGESDCANAEEKTDALHYLKEYQKIEDEYEELKDWWAEEHAENVPLTWSDLQEMTGKPVWIELYSVDRKAWGLNDGTFIDAFGNDCITFKVLHDLWHFSKKGIGKDWQAYRKELK